MGDEAAAEEDTRNAFAKSVETAASVRDDERVVAWFYRSLRNAVMITTGAGAPKTVRSRLSPPNCPRRPTRRRKFIAPCANASVACSLPPPSGNQNLLRAVDLDETPVVAAASERGIAAGNARVRLHRAREALRRRVKRHAAHARRTDASIAHARQLPALARNVRRSAASARTMETAMTETSSHAACCGTGGERQAQGDRSRMRHDG